MFFEYSPCATYVASYCHNKYTVIIHFVIKINLPKHQIRIIITLILLALKREIFKNSKFADIASKLLGLLG